MGVEQLRATSCLAENSWPILESLVAALQSEAFEITIVPDLDPSDADVLFACGLFTRELIAGGASLEIVAAPIFSGETTASYRSVVVARDDRDIDLASAEDVSLAVNDYGSWSGWYGYLALLHDHGRSAPPIERRIESGSHLRSIDAVASERADVAAIDSSVWRHHANLSGGLQVVAVTPDWPAPPVSVSPRVDPAARAILGSLPAMVPTSSTAYDEMLAVRRSFN